MTTQKRLQRSDDDRWIGGVCGGLADYTGVDAGLIRLVVAVATILGAGSLIVIYVVAWIIMPKAELGDPVPRPAPAPPSE